MRNVDKLITALRSGEYKQTRHRLKDSEGYCCLGVGCDIYAKDNQDGKWTTVDNFTGSVTFQTKNLISAINMNFAVKNWFGINDEQEEKLMEMNDILRKSFSEIADYLEETFKIVQS